MSLSKRMTTEVLDHHIKCLSEGNLSGAVLDYCEESVIITPNGVVRGLEEITDFLKNSIENVLPPDSHHEMIASETEGDVAYIFWKAESRVVKFLIGSDTFIIRNGKIIIQTFAGLMEEKLSSRKEN